MLSPKELRSHTFQQNGRNTYKASEVDEYFSEVAASYEQMFRENGEIVKKLQAVADKLSEYKKDEENIRNALLEAQRMRSSILDDANKKANERLSTAEEKIKAAKVSVDNKTAEIISEANSVADDIVSSAKTSAAEIVSNAEQQSKEMADKAKKLYEAEVGTINDEAKKAKAYLDGIKAETAKLRAQLMETYKSQLDMLQFVPDFTSEVLPDSEQEDDSGLVDAMSAVSEELNDTFDEPEEAQSIFKSLADLEGIDEYLSDSAEEETEDAEEEADDESEEKPEE